LVGLTGIEPWIKMSDWVNPATASARESGYSATIVSAGELLNREQLERIGGDWRFQQTLFTRSQTPTASTFLRLRLPIKGDNPRMTRAVMILAQPDGRLIASGSYATFTPNR
jgi:hypothetical protein